MHATVNQEEVAREVRGLRKARVCIGDGERVREELPHDVPTLWCVQQDPPEWQVAGIRRGKISDLLFFFFSTSALLNSATWLSFASTGVLQCMCVKDKKQVSRKG